MTKELYDKGTALLEAAHAYWKEAQRAGIPGAVIWLQSQNGNTVIYTRGEYRSHLLYNIDSIDAPKFFNHLNELREYGDSEAVPLDEVET